MKLTGTTRVFLMQRYLDHEGYSQFMNHRDDGSVRKVVKVELTRKATDVMRVIAWDWTPRVIGPDQVIEEHEERFTIAYDIERDGYDKGWTHRYDKDVSGEAYEFIKLNGRYLRHHSSGGVISLSLQSWDEWHSVWVHLAYPGRRYKGEEVRLLHQSIDIELDEDSVEQLRTLVQEILNATN